MRPGHAIGVIALLAAATTASAAERHAYTPVPGTVRPVTFTILDHDGIAPHPNCSYGAPCCCVDPQNPNDRGVCTGVKVCSDSYGKCTGDSSKCAGG